MPASVSLSSLANGVVPVSGSGHSGTVAILAVAFTASNGRRRSRDGTGSLTVLYYIMALA